MILIQDLEYFVWQQRCKGVPDKSKDVEEIS